jgi:hypothetical protein
MTMADRAPDPLIQWAPRPGLARYRCFSYRSWSDLVGLLQAGC